uniref:Uncharacterized protein n=1 Tax=Cannabis sativa TaxID=3483 RepID=A0A803P4X5_CANSA
MSGISVMIQLVLGRAFFSITTKWLSRFTVRSKELPSQWLKIVDLLPALALECCLPLKDFGVAASFTWFFGGLSLLYGVLDSSMSVGVF